MPHLIREIYEGPENDGRIWWVVRSTLLKKLGFTLNDWDQPEEILDDIWVNKYNTNELWFGVKSRWALEAWFKNNDIYEHPFVGKNPRATYRCVVIEFGVKNEYTERMLVNLLSNAPFIGD